MHDPARIPFSKIAVCIGKAGDSRIYFMADLHFYHDHIIRLANRPYQNAVTMNQALVENWNRRICNNEESCVCPGNAEEAKGQKVSDRR